MSNFNQKKKAAESKRLLIETKGKQTTSIRTCEAWFRRFESGDFNFKYCECSGKPQRRRRAIA